MRPVDCVETSLLLLPEVFSTNDCMSMCESILGDRIHKTRITKILARFSKFGLVAQITPLTANRREYMWLNLYCCADGQNLEQTV